ncbi:hypothetical protein [Kitasatospora sp. A2-31]|uniref:hypothetical protein n=1 Tax=Kitasatospora sp. A2-31 TaxID=2916414 RepID=UPI001EEAAF1B|nr:hypothetical protein [Kitasatospora sp. A2-31]MCG6497059.1 hypothetical protein [Kitasatospora sp. A2-31]
MTSPQNHLSPVAEFAHALAQRLPDRWEATAMDLRDDADLRHHFYDRVWDRRNAQDLGLDRDTMAESAVLDSPDGRRLLVLPAAEEARFLICPLIAFDVPVYASNSQLSSAVVPADPATAAGELAESLLPVYESELRTRLERALGILDPTAAALATFLASEVEHDPELAEDLYDMRAVRWLSHPEDTDLLRCATEEVLAALGLLLGHRGPLSEALVGVTAHVRMYCEVHDSCEALIEAEVIGRILAAAGLADTSSGIFDPAITAKIAAIDALPIEQQRALVRSAFATYTR